MNAPARLEQSDQTMTAMIERVALDPNVAIDKLERMLDMQERIWAKQARDAYCYAFARMQAEMPEIPRNGVIKIREAVQSRYALFEDIVKYAKPVLHKHGFGLSHRCLVEGSDMIVTGVLSHEQGHEQTDTISLPFDTSGNKNAVQARGSALQYGKRYTASNLLLITSTGEDDDGIGAVRGALVSEAQYLTLRNMIEEADADEAKFLKFLRVDQLVDLPASQYSAAVGALTKKIKARPAASRAGGQ